MIGSTSMKPREGSVLATSISLVAVFLTLVVGSMAYVQSSMSHARSERLRASAQEAARSGMDLVLGWAEANIDAETRLPKAWDSMQDGDVIDPIGGIMENTGTVESSLLKIAKARTVGTILGNLQHEYVVAVTGGDAEGRGAYVTTFKSRIQQFRISENMPRQYRIGVIGRVRKVSNNATRDNVDTNERDTIVAERVIMTYVGKETTSRYAALIDIDGVKNWVPGEEITGPVHINRGYVDEEQFRTATIDLGGAGGNTVVPGTTAKYKDLRSVMMLYIDGQSGNVGFKANGGTKYPVFESQVSVTEISAGDPKYTNFDPAGAPIAVQVNGKPWHSTTDSDADAHMKDHDKIFLAPENSTTKRYGTSDGGVDFVGPLVVKQPITLPRSIRNALGSAVGMPGSFTVSDLGAAEERGRWKNLPDGVYVPTARFWAIDGTNTADQPPPTDSYGDSTSSTPHAYAPVGGIYVRGEVEVMRMAVGQGTVKHMSFYLFQVRDLAGNRRCYMVVANRTSKQLCLVGFKPSTASRLSDIIGAGGRTTENLFGETGLSATGAWTFTSTTNPDSFKVSRDIKDVAVFAAPKYSDFPFNGVIYVDCSKDDPARPNDANAWQTMATTGNVLALGNLGAPTAPTTNKTTYAIDGLGYDSVATYTEDVPANPASKLTIMARGNIFIQNHLIVDATFKAYVAKGGANAVNADTATGTARDYLSQITLSDTKDLLGLVSDKQVVVGLAAPSNTTKGKAGVVVMAAIAALGDPAYRPWLKGIDTAYLDAPRSYIGSFTTEGLMLNYNLKENYFVAYKNNTVAANVVSGSKENLDNDSDRDTYNTDKLWFFRTQANGGYPGNPIYRAPDGNSNVGEGISGVDQPTENPNNDLRGRMVVFGSITQKKRGIVGQGNNSYDKDFVFDKRLLTIAPPIFPSSVNVQVRSSFPFSPDQADPKRALPYRSGTTTSPVGDLDFLGALPDGTMPS